MFKEGDTVIVSRIDTGMKEHICIGDLKSIFNEKGKVIGVSDESACVVFFSNGKKLWVPKSLLDRVCKTVKIEIEVDVSNEAKYVAVGSDGSVYEYTDSCHEGFGEKFSGTGVIRLTVKNWKQTKTKVG